jgi:hypothetical protein
LRALAILVPLLLPAAGRASLVGESVTVTLTDGGALGLSQGVVVGAGPEITPGDGSQIGGVLLPNESVDIGDSAITVSLEEGDTNHGTGFPAGTRYVFSGLYFGPNVGIVNVDVQLDNVSGVSLGSEVTFTPSAVTLLVDTLTIGSVPDAVDVGAVTLSLVLPEPRAGSASAAAVAAVLALGRRSARRA